MHALGAGVSVIAALEMLSEQTENKMLRIAVTECKTSIEKGESLANSMRRQTKVFPDIFVTMVEAGEASGSLDVSFTRMAEQFEKQAKLKATVKKASIYPIVVCIVAVVVVIAMLVFVIPTFEDMFESLGTELPAITKMVVGASKFMQKYWYIVFAAVAGIAMFIRTFKKTPNGQHFFGKLAMKIPIFGNLTVKSACAGMSRTLSTLIAAGIPLIDAIDITANTMGNIYFKEALLEAKDDVAVGAPLSEPIERSGIFPPLVYHMLGIGEETGDIDGMLTKMAGYYEEEVEQATAQVMAALEPMIIIVLAVVIGTIIMAVISPMASMYSALDSM